MDLNKYLTNSEGTNILRRFAFIGTRENFDFKLKWLERLAEPEKWRFQEGSAEDIYVLFYYIIHTFDQCFRQEKIEITEDQEHASFNTGLMSSSGEEIYGLFTKSTTYDPQKPSSNYWHLDRFLKETDRNYMNTGLKSPEMATFFSDYNELYFDPTYEIVLYFDHIYDDNFDRLPFELQQLDKDVACQVFRGFLNHTIKKIKRNGRIPVPQYYKNKIMFLIPVKSFGKDTIVLALEKYDNKTYRGNTILTMGMAYNCARLLTKPESNWLLPK